MRVTVRLFGSIREAVGSKELSVAVPEGASVVELRELLARSHVGFERLGAPLRVSVNRELASEDTALADGDEVAFLPPVSGGGPRCSLSEHPLDVSEVMRRVGGPDAGGVVVFLGTVRNHSRGRAIRRLEYEAYAEMAEQEMGRIVAEAERRWPGVRVAIAHRSGALAVGEIAVVVAVAAPHRHEAFSACRFAIETLKERVPIWKKEVASDGEYWVEEHA